MKSMYVSVVATRQKTKTVIRSVHIVPMMHNGPQRTIDLFATCMASKLTGDWILNVMTITTHEYNAFMNQLNMTEAAKL